MLCGLDRHIDSGVFVGVGALPAQACVALHTQSLVAAAVCCDVSEKTLLAPQAAVEVRKQVNRLDNLTTSKAVDALLNAGVCVVVVCVW